jgi:hypothetical protein
MNVEYTCPVYGTTQQTVGETGEGVEVPECPNPACTAEPAWGAITVSMMKQAVVTVAQTHPQNTATHTAAFILRLLGRVRKVPAVSDPDSVVVWTDALNKLASR